MVALRYVGRLAWPARLVHLKGLTNLETLELVSTQVTAAGVAELQQLLPNCKITKSSSDLVSIRLPRLLSLVLFLHLAPRRVWQIRPLFNHTQQVERGNGCFSCCARRCAIVMERRRQLF